MKILRSAAIFLLAAVLIVLLVALCLIIFLTVSEYRPDDLEQLTMSYDSQQRLSPKDSLDIVTFNIGYCSLGAQEDFFMDGGEHVRPDDLQTVEQYLNGITSDLKLLDADVYFVQEADVDSKRSYYTDQVEAISDALGLPVAFAKNFCCQYVPYPIPTIGKVNSGILTATGLETARVERISLESPFKWPVSMANLKRCLMVTRINVADKELVLINLHLEAYDNGSGKEAQTKFLMDFIAEEYEKGNYVIAGGDFNQAFPDSTAVYPYSCDSGWIPGQLSNDMLPPGFSFAYDLSSPSCRLLDAPYAPGETDVYVIDGFIVSDNITVNDVKTIDLKFENADHNPIRLSVTLN